MIDHNGSSITEHWIEATYFSQYIKAAVFNQINEQKLLDIFLRKVSNYVISYEGNMKITSYVLEWEKT